MPVVTPNRACASTETVNAVPMPSVLRSTINGSSSASARSSVSGTHSMPRPCFTMKFTSAGVIFAAAHTRSPSFSRSSSSATMTRLPARIASMASSTLSNGMCCSFALAARAPSPRGCPALEVFDDEPAEHVTFQVDERASAQPAQVGMLPSIRDYGDLRAARRRQRVYRETHAIDRDRAVQHGDFRDVVGDRDVDHDALIVLRHRLDPAHSIHMPLH